MSVKIIAKNKMKKKIEREKRTKKKLRSCRQVSKSRDTGPKTKDRKKSSLPKSSA